MSKRCSARNRKGHICGAWALEGSTQCALHLVPGRAAELGKKHGRRREDGSQLEVLDLPYKPLKTSSDVSELLEETINRVRQGSLDLRAANTIGFLSGIHLKALAQRAQATPETKNDEASGGIYMSLFQRLGSAAPDQEAFDLFPQPRRNDAGILSDPLPASEESIDDPPTPPNNPLGVITVEVG